MRRLFSIFIFFLFSSLMLFAQEERVYTFHSEIDIEVSGEIQVHEKIKVYAAGDLFKRGITRALPLSRSDVSGNRIRVDYKIQKILQDGKKVKFFTERVGNELIIYVGEENKFLDPGFYDYEIFYSSPGQLGFFDGFDELTWNVNGLSEYVTDTVSCLIRMPGDAQVINHHCYTGAYGSTSSNCSSEILNNNTAYYSEATFLKPDEMLTVSASFTQGVVQQKGTASYRLTHFDKYGLVYFTLLFLVFFAFYYSYTWQKYGIDPPKPVVIPQFTPPDGLSPASVGMLQKEIYTDDLITASVVNLAVKGYIRIKEEEVKSVFGLKKDKHFTLFKLKNADELLPDEERKVMSELFKSGDETVITGKYSSAIENMMRSFRSSLNRQYTSILREGLNLKFHIIPLLSFPIYIYLVYRFTIFEPTDLIATYFKTMAMALLPLLILSLIISRVRKVLKSRFFSIFIGSILLAGSIGVFLTKPISSLSPNAIAFLIGFPLLVIGYYFYSYLIVRPGEKRLDYQAKIEGLKMFIDVAEEQQMQYFNPPDITPEVFEQLLPYAIALNMDKIWGDKFQNKFLSSLAQQTPYQPVWYTGSVMRPAMFGSSLRNSLYGNIRSSSIAPTSSGRGGGSWGSSSSGGGFSGGGGGGGRVGGW